MRAPAPFADRACASYVLSPARAQARLAEEASLGLTSDFFYERFRARSGVTAAWLEEQLLRLRASGYALGGYGAAAKGMVLLHFLLGRGRAASHLEFVLDDAPLKQGTYCPGTSIPVRPTSHVADVLRARPGTPLALIVFAWNFWPEIASRLQSTLSGLTMRRPLIAVLPFPSPRVLTLRGDTVTRMPYRPTPLGDPLSLGTAALAPSAARRRRVMLISHFYNEAALLPYFIRHHAHMFDHAVLIDYGSTDGSAEIVRREAPLSWRVVPSTEAQFGADALDQQVCCLRLSGCVCVAVCVAVGVAVCVAFMCGCGWRCG